ncbi:MAG TPA: GntG family PLP-dependent aldolase [Longimicrobiales bacterium]|nr:GntG family PLP-dependent aldolase [Longimicrobiales bacterium]
MSERDDVIDLRSDTVTRPVPEMRRAIADAIVGDDALGDDPTVRRLERRVADLLDKEAALFFPSGTMANQAALLVLTRPGTEVVCEATCHLVDWELGGAAANAGVQLRGVHGPGGILTPELVAAAIRPKAQLVVQTSLVSLENTHNGAGGRVTPLETMRALFRVAQDAGVRLHLDGARLWNAAAATGVPMAEFAACADTVMVALSKGLGCPAGSLLAGPAPLIEQARIARRRLGGAMRQAGILAAAGLYALDHHRERLADDHQRARTLARLAAHVPGLRVVDPETNIVMMDVTKPGLSAADVVREMEAHGILITAFTPTRVRAVTHLDVDDDGVRRAAEALAAVMA